MSSQGLHTDSHYFKGAQTKTRKKNIEKTHRKNTKKKRKMVEKLKKQFEKIKKVYWFFNF